MRHGTSWSNYKSILKTGVDLSRGGTTTKNSKIICPNFVLDNARKRFFVFRDSKYGITKEGNRILSYCTIPVRKRAWPSRHTYLAYLAEYNKEYKDARYWMILAAFIKTVLTPKLKFIYTLQEIEGSPKKAGVFEKDPDYSNEAAYRTSHPLSSDRIGMLGFITHVDRTHVWEHIKENPCRCIQGITQLGIGIILTAIPGLGYLT